jgi:hypothetical protein
MESETTATGLDGVSSGIILTFSESFLKYFLECAGHLTAKSDMYSFDVVLLELLSGRRALVKNRASGEQTWWSGRGRT